MRKYFVASGIAGVPYLLKPNSSIEWASTNIKTNEEGIREVNNYILDNENIHRTLVIGDSITFGLGVDQDNSFPKILETILNKNDSKKEFEVINGGISGFNIRDEKNLMRYLTSHYKPDLILWCINSNDFDDSFTVSEEGRMVGGKDYSAFSAYHYNKWGYEGDGIDKDNYLNSINKNKRDLALNNIKVSTESLFDQLESFICRKSFLYCLIKNRLSPFYNQNIDPLKSKINKELVPTTVYVENEIGRELLLELGPIYVSPYFKERFENALRQGVSFAQINKIPIVLVSFNLFIDHEIIPDHGNVYFQEINDYLEIPFYKFRARYNLGWDPHYNPTGNRVIANSLFTFLSENKLVPYNPKEQTGRKVNTSYKKQYVQALDGYINTLRPWINFEKFENIDQLIGGIGPVCIFPVYGKPLHLLLGNPKNSHFSLKLFNMKMKQQVFLTIFNGFDTIEQKLEVGKGDFIWSQTVPDSFVTKNNLLDVSLNCLSDRCEGMKLKFIGFNEN